MSFPIYSIIQSVDLSHTLPCHKDNKDTPCAHNNLRITLIDETTRTISLHGDKISSLLHAISEKKIVHMPFYFWKNHFSYTPMDISKEEVQQWLQLKTKDIDRLRLLTLST